MAGSVCCCVMWDRPPSLSEPVCFSVKWIMNPSPPTSQRCLENQGQTDCKGGFLLSLGFSPIPEPLSPLSLHPRPPRPTFIFLAALV